MSMSNLSVEMDEDKECFAYDDCPSKEIMFTLNDRTSTNDEASICLHHLREFVFSLKASKTEKNFVFRRFRMTDGRAVVAKRVHSETKRENWCTEYHDNSGGLIVLPNEKCFVCEEHIHGDEVVSIDHAIRIHKENCLDTLVEELNSVLSEEVPSFFQRNL